MLTGVVSGENEAWCSAFTDTGFSYLFLFLFPFSPYFGFFSPDLDRCPAPSPLMCPSRAPVDSAAGASPPPLPGACVSSSSSLVVQWLSHVPLFLQDTLHHHHQAPLSVEFSRQEHWSGLPFPSPGDLPRPGIEPGSSVLETHSLPLSLLGSSV